MANVLFFLDVIGLETSTNTPIVKNALMLA
jgi:hypothetical protein